MQKKKGPWTVTDSLVVYQNPWIKVIEDKVIRPDGKPGIFAVTEIKPGSSVIALDEHDMVYLTKEYHYALGKVNYEGASGGIDGKESKLACAKRELKEETGLVARKWTYLGVVDPMTSMIRSPQYLYLAEDLKQESTRPDGTEVIQVVKIPFKKAVDMVMNGQITYGATVAGILKIALLKDKNTR